MKNRLVQIVIFIFGINNINYAQWTEIRPPYGIYLNSNLVPLNGKVFTTTSKDGKVYFVKTEDLIHWEKVSELSDVEEEGFENSYDSGIFYVFNQLNGIASINFSDNGGNSWVQIDNSKIPSSTKYFHTHNNYWIVANSNTIFGSNDFGKSFDILKNTSDEIVSLIRSTTGLEIAVTKTEILISDDDGKSWNIKSLPYSANTDFKYFKIFSNDAGIFIATEVNGQYFLYRSNDDLKSWKNIAMPNTYSNVYSIISNKDGWFVYANYIYYSSDEGKSWVNRDYLDSGQLANSNDTLYSSGYYGFFKSYDKAKTWITGNVDWDKIYPGFTNGRIYISEYGLSFDYYQDRLYFSNFNGIFSTDVNGDEWKFYERSGLNQFNYNFFFKNDTIGFYGDNGFFSKDKGKNWTKLITQYGNKNDPYHKDRIFEQAGNFLFSKYFENDNLFRSNDWGVTWKQIPFFQFWNNTFIGFGNNLYVNSDKGIQSSQNYGDSFSDNYEGIGPYKVERMLNSGHALFAEYKDRLYQLINNVWTLSDGGLDDLKPDYYISKIAGNSNIMAMSCEKNQGVDLPRFYYSVDGGKNWNIELSDLLTDINLFQTRCTVNENNIYYSGPDNKNGLLKVYKIAIPSVGVSNLNENHDLNIFPNPSPGRFNIDIDLKVGSWKVYNLLGTLIKEGDISKSEIDLTDCSAGIYLVSVGDKDGLVTKKVMIMK